MRLSPVGRRLLSTTPKKGGGYTLSGVWKRNRQNLYNIGMSTVTFLLAGQLLQVREDAYARCGARLGPGGSTGWGT